MTDVEVCPECGTTYEVWKIIYNVKQDRQAFASLLIRLRDATKPLDAADRNLLVRLLEPMVKG